MSKYLCCKHKWFCDCLYHLLLILDERNCSELLLQPNGFVNTMQRPVTACGNRPFMTKWPLNTCVSIDRVSIYNRGGCGATCRVPKPCLAGVLPNNRLSTHNPGRGIPIRHLSTHDGAKGPWAWPLQQALPALSLLQSAKKHLMKLPIILRAVWWAWWWIFSYTGVLFWNLKINAGLKYGRKIKPVKYNKTAPFSERGCLRGVLRPLVLYH